jgi:CDP-4-dehydro-6-deoxyglucose reductase
VRVSLYKSDRSFSVAPGESLLDAALHAGLNLPHSCKGGNCGACRARLIEGEVSYPDGPPLGLADSEVADGLILLCQARARGDLAIETFAAAAPDEIQVKRLPCRIERTERLAHDVIGLYLRLPAAERFDFKPGQYLDILLSKGRRRSFSIASPPHDSRLLELHVRRAAGGEFTEQVFTEGIRGALLTIEGPLGEFFYRETSPPAGRGAPMLLVGGGTGLAPLKSIIRHVIENDLPREITLYWGVQSERDLYAHAALEEIGRREPRLRYVPVLSQASPAWNGLKGLVHEAVLDQVRGLERYEVYASGPPQMIEAVRREFGLRGLDRARLFSDSFDYAPDSAARQRMRADTNS